MVSDGRLDLPSESGFDDKFPAYITKAAGDDGREVPHWVNRSHSRVTCRRLTLRGLASAPLKENLALISSPSCGDIQILFESVYCNL